MPHVCSNEVLERTLQGRYESMARWETRKNISSREGDWREFVSPCCFYFLVNLHMYQSNAVITCFVIMLKTVVRVNAMDRDQIC